MAEFDCRACTSANTTLVLDLGMVPAADTFAEAGDPRPDRRFPLTLYVCGDCSLVQLGPLEDTPGPEESRAVDSQTARRHARASVATVVEQLGLSPGQTVIELDSAHGASWLPSFVEAGLVPLPEDAVADLVVDVHHLMHAEDLNEVMAAHARRMSPSGHLVCEFFHVRPLVEHCLIDTIRHGHFAYLSVIAMERLLARHSLALVDAVPVVVYGGSVRATVRHAASAQQAHPRVAEIKRAESSLGVDGLDALLELGARGREVTTALRRHLEGLAAAGRTVAGYGAPSKAPVLLALAEVDVDLLPFTVDLAPQKHGLRVPGTGIPIHPVERLLSERPDDVIVLTWDIAEEVAGHLGRSSAGIGWSPRLYVPLPEPRTLTLPTG